MKTKSLLECSALLLFLTIHLYPLAEEATQISTESFPLVLWNHHGEDMTITVSGKNKPSDGNVIKLDVFAKISSVNGGRSEFLNTYLTKTNAQNKWSCQIRLNGKDTLTVETYILETRTETKEIGTYYLSIISPRKSKFRQDEIQNLQKLTANVWDLDMELNNTINTIENTKQGKTGWEINIQQTIGIYNRPEEALTLSIKKWRDWEQSYLKKIENLTENITIQPSLTGFINIQEKISSISNSIYERYAQYRTQILGPPRKISYYPATPATQPPNYNKDKLLFIIEQEITSKIFQETLSLLEYLDLMYITVGPTWPDVQKKIVGLCSELKKEIELYDRAGLLSNNTNKKTYNTSQSLISLISNISLLAEKINGVNNTNINSEEIQNIIGMLNNKISSLSSQIY
jgi:hypothetical protein